MFLIDIPRRLSKPLTAHFHFQGFQIQKTSCFAVIQDNSEPNDKKEAVLNVSVQLC